MVPSLSVRHRLQLHFLQEGIWIVKSSTGITNLRMNLVIDSYSDEFSYFRYQLEGEYDRRGLMTMADVGDPGSSFKQVLSYFKQIFK